MYYIKDKKNRGSVYVFQNEKDGTQIIARYLYEETALKVLATLNENNNNRYYITKQ